MGWAQYALAWKIVEPHQDVSHGLRRFCVLSNDDEMKLRKLILHRVSLEIDRTIGD